MALYCYFEALGVGISDRTAEDIQPWLDANNVVLLHLAVSAVLSLTLLADSRTSLSAPHPSHPLLPGSLDRAALEAVGVVHEHNLGNWLKGTRRSEIW